MEFLVIVCRFSLSVLNPIFQIYTFFKSEEQDTPIPTTWEGSGKGLWNYKQRFLESPPPTGDFLSGRPRAGDSQEKVKKNLQEKNWGLSSLLFRDQFFFLIFSSPLIIED